MMLWQTLDRWAEREVVRCFNRMREGRLTVELPDGARTYGPGGGHVASMRIHSSRFFRRLVTGGEIGLGEGYMDGDWSTPDLVPLIRLMLANREALSGLPALALWMPRAVESIAHRLRDNTRAGSRRNIHEHYDLGNRFFEPAPGRQIYVGLSLGAGVR